MQTLARKLNLNARLLLLACAAGLLLTAGGCADPHVCQWRAEKIRVIHGLQAAECALPDPITGNIYASNMNYDPNAELPAKYWGDDGNGSIGVLSDEKLVKLHWCGSDKNSTIHSPKGMCLASGRLWVADNNRVIVIDPASGKQVRAIVVPGAKFLNDMASDGKYAYAADTASGRITRVGPGPMEHYKGPSTANGLGFRGDKLYCARWGEHDIFEIDMSGKEEAKPVGLADQFEGLDAIEALPDGSFLVSDQPTSRIVWVSADFKKVEMLVSVNKPADFGIDLKRGRIYAPTFFDNTVTIFSLERK